MPRYEYACNVCGHREDQVRPMADRDAVTHCPACRKKNADSVRRRCFDAKGPVQMEGYLHRDAIAGMTPHTDKGYDRPILSDALGVHPEQIPDMKRKYPHHNFTPDGRMILSGHGERNRVMKELGYHDKN